MRNRRSKTCLLKNAFFLLLVSACGDGGELIPPAPPAVTTSSVLPAPDNAVLNGIVNPNGLATDAWFEYGQDNTLSTFTKTADQPIPTGTAPVSIQGTLTGLVPGTIYYFRVMANNAAGTSSGTIESFSTALSPTAITTAANSLPDNAVINGIVNPNGLETNAWFEWGTDPTPNGFTTTLPQLLEAGTTSVSIQAPLTSLTPGTTYYFRVVAVNSAGTSKGTIENFKASQIPSTSTNAANPVSSTTATLNGSVNPNGLLTNYWFVWGTDPNLTNPALTHETPMQGIPAGTFSTQAVSAPLSGLSVGTAYYFRVVAGNTDGQSQGTIRSFTTFVSPTVSTNPATSITTTGALLNGDVNPNGYATVGWFEYGQDNDLSTFEKTADQPISPGTAPLPFNAPISGLTPWRTYYYRAAASNGGGEQKGAIMSFPTGEYYVAVGDSITRGSHDDYPEDGIGFEPILNNLLTAAKGYPHTVVNEGVSGDTSADGAALISTPGPNNPLSKNPSAKYVLVLYGTNDAFIPALPSGVGLIPGNPGYAGSYKANMQAIITAIRNVGKIPYLAKVPYTTDLSRRIESIQEYNAAIDELVENGISATPPDFYSYFHANPDRLADGTHPDGIGYREMADRWCIALMNPLQCYSQ